MLYYTVSRDSAGILDLKIYACACALILKSHAEADSFLSRERVPLCVSCVCELTTVCSLSALCVVCVCFVCVLVFSIHTTVSDGAVWETR